MPTFNLIDEPWIPCLFLDKPPRELSLREVFQRVREVKEVYDPSPLVTMALHRLLLAILHRNFGPASVQQWRLLWENGFDGRILTSYFDKWRDRFDLFDSKRPFYQVGAMPDARKHPVHILSLEAAAPNNPTLFDHSSYADPEHFSPARAARCLVASQAYAIGFGNSRPFNLIDSTLIRGYSVLNLGNNLQETLCLNLVDYDEKEDLPAWEKDFFPAPDRDGNSMTGYVDYLTWQSRRIHLIPEGTPPVVRWCQRLQGLVPPIKLNPNKPDRPYFIDPFKAYFYVDKGPQKGWAPRRFIPDMAIWRDSHALFQSADELKRQPKVFEIPRRMMDLINSRKIAGQLIYGFLIAGLSMDAKNRAKILFWRQERLPLPLAYLEDRKLYNWLTDALKMAEKTSGTLKYYLKELAALISAGDGTSLLQAWAPERLYFSKLEIPFRRLLLELPDDKTDGGDYGINQLPHWTRLLYQTALHTFNSVAAGLGESARSIQAIAKVKDRFTWSLYKNLLKEGENGDGSNGKGSESATSATSAI